MALRVLVKHRPIDNYFHQGKTYIEGRKGSEYELQYTNSTGHRQKIVVSVDGLNVCSGDNNWEKGYVVEPYQNLTIPGWRKDSGNVAKFEFSSIKSSYNQHNDKGEARNIGVIGCKVFAEKPKTNITINYSPPLQIWNYPYYYPYNYPYNGLMGSNNLNTFNDNHTVQCSYTCDATPIYDESGFTAGAGVTQTSGSTLRSVPQNSVGTGWGENKKFETQTVHFDFEPNPEETILIYYDERRGLERRGIDIHDYTRYNHEPNAFPGDGCPPPK